MIVGLRVVKTAVAIMISISIARLLGLEPDHFAGIISMLAVQPSVYRSLRHSLTNLASALFAALLGISIVELIGSSAPIIAAVAFLVMALHVRLKQTASLPLAVIVAVNTMGTADELFGSAAFHQIALVLIGMTVGTAVNFIRRPVHSEREEVLLSKSEAMLRTLLYYVRIDLENGRMTPYKPDMRNQLDEVRDYIEKGQAISQLIREDRWLGKKTGAEQGGQFRIYETMVERIRDLIKALQKADQSNRERERLNRAIGILIRAQERMLEGRRVPLGLLKKAFRPDTGRLDPRVADDAVMNIFPYYQAYEALLDYTIELAALIRPTIVLTDSGTAMSDKKNGDKLPIPFGAKEAAASYKN
ncbi:MAG: hypothetical protein K0R67_3103 [Paenibacillus sp.]|jgi:uncharacterized membrane protein YgaE (UPF0421/DUF939 family)|nr:hypothetical protein [Paenibacillus sp.]